MSVDLEELGKIVDEALEKETSESLTKWLNERRQKADARIEKEEQERLDSLDELTWAM